MQLSCSEIVGSVFLRIDTQKEYKNAIMTSFSAVKSNMVYARSASKHNFVDKAFSHVLKFRKKSKIVDFRGIIVQTKLLLTTSQLMSLVAHFIGGLIKIITPQKMI